MCIRDRDKTGTLTQNKMHVVSSYANGALQTRSEELLRGFCLCNNATVQKEEILGAVSYTHLECIFLLS